MKGKQAVSLVLGASLCLPLTACATESQIVETSYETHPDITHATLGEPYVPVLPEATTLIPRDEDMVRVADYIPGILTELKYSTPENFTGQVIYSFQDVYLRYGTVKKLKDAQVAFGEIGLRLKIWDGFRPAAAQFRLWEACPDSNFVADPEKGYSNHTRGNAVDVTLVDEDGQELEMPTEFDNFSEKANRDYSDCTDIQRENAMLMQDVMEKNGFSGYFGEWWHFNDTDSYEPETEFDPTSIG